MPKYSTILFFYTVLDPFLILGFGLLVKKKKVDHCWFKSIEMDGGALTTTSQVAWELCLLKPGTGKKVSSSSWVYTSWKGV